MKKNIIWFMLLVIGLLLVYVPSYSQLQHMQKKNSEYANEVTSLIEENKNLQRELHRLREDPEYLEKVARERMNLLKEGEVIYKIRPTQDETD